MSQPSQYLESKVLTASQPQLHIMLLDGALRFGRQAQNLWATGADFHEVSQPLVRMTDIVEELVTGLATAKEEISKQLEEQYAFIYRELISSRINQQPSQLDSSLELLAYQRETWKLATEKLESQDTAAAPVASPTPTMPHIQVDASATSPGLSLEA